MDEFTALMRARELVRKVNPAKIPISVEAYVAAIEARVDYDASMAADEAGCSVPIGGKIVICVNGNDHHERQRFTICHEIA